MPYAARLTIDQARAAEATSGSLRLPSPPRKRKRGSDEDDDDAEDDEYEDDDDASDDAEHPRKARRNNEHAAPAGVPPPPQPISVPEGIPATLLPGPAGAATPSSRRTASAAASRMRIPPSAQLVPTPSVSTSEALPQSSLPMGMPPMGMSPMGMPPMSMHALSMAEKRNRHFAMPTPGSGPAMGAPMPYYPMGMMQYPPYGMMYPQMPPGAPVSMAGMPMPYMPPGPMPTPQMMQFMLSQQMAFADASNKAAKQA